MVNSGIWVPSVETVEAGSMFVPGAGMEPTRNTNGLMALPSRQTSLNASAAAGLMRFNQELEMAFLTGDGSNPDKAVFGSREKDLMASVMVANGVKLERLWIDTKESSTSWGNIRGDFPEFLDRYGKRPVLVVAAPGHAERIRWDARRVYGKQYDFIPFHAKDARQGLVGEAFARTTEAAITGFYATVFTGAKTPEQLDARHDWAQKWVLGPTKAVARALHSRRYA